MNTPQTTPAVCELELKNGRMCAVAAIGRCTVCERAYCSTHQAERYTYVLGVPHVVAHDSMCVTCAAEMDAKLAEPAMREGEALQYLSSGAARSALLAAKVPTVEIFQIKQELKRGFLHNRWVDVITPWQHGWVLGEFEWSGTRSKGFPDGDLQETFHTNHFAALLEAPSDPGTVIPVRPHAGGYAFDAWDRNLHPPSSLALAEAIKRLITGSGLS